MPSQSVTEAVEWLSKTSSVEAGRAVGRSSMLASISAMRRDECMKGVEKRVATLSP